VYEWDLKKAIDSVLGCTPWFPGRNIKALNNFQINSKLVWNCDHSCVKLVEYDRVQLIWVPGHMGIERNEIL